MAEILILTGPVRSGKTTRLAEWARARGGVSGLLQPDGPGGRLFVDIATGAAEPLEPAAPGEPAVAVGRFRFRAAAFAWAQARLLAAPRGPEAWALVDEVGPLELAGGGLRPALDDHLATHRGTLLLVVRDTLAAHVRSELAPQARIAPCAGWPQAGHGATGVP